MDRLEFLTPGMDAQLREALRANSLLVAAERDGLREAQEVFAAARADYGRLIGLLYEAGFYAPTIRVRLDGREAADISPLAPPAMVRDVRVEIETGPAFSFGRTEVQPLADGTSLPADFRSGELARSTAIRDAAEAAVSGWRNVGHARAAPVAQDITADHRNTLLDASITIDPGQRLRFGRLHVDGQERTRPERIREIAGLPEGEQFTPAAVERAATRLRRTGTFASVTLREADEDGPDQTIDIEATVAEAPLRRLGFGAEVDSFEGARLTAYWLHRNLFGGAERLRVEGEVGSIGARLGGIDYRVSVQYDRPATFTPDTTLVLGARAERVNERDYDAYRLSFEGGVSHIFSPNLTGEAALGYRFEDASVPPGPRRRYSSLVLPVGLTWDRRDNPLDPAAGFYLNTGVTPYVGFAGTDSGVQGRLDARGYFSPGDDGRLVFAARAQAGVVLGASLANTPREYLFYSGGGGTVRGHPFRSLGAPGQPSGGQGFAALSGELRYAINDSFGLVAFADAGHVSTGPFSGPGGWHAGAGLGLRYLTTIGPIRLDVGLPVHGATASGVQVYLGIGQAF